MAFGDVGSAAAPVYGAVHDVDLVLIEVRPDLIAPAPLSVGTVTMAVPDCGIAHNPQGWQRRVLLAREVQLVIERWVCSLRGRWPILACTGPAFRKSGDKPGDSQNASRQPSVFSGTVGTRPRFFGIPGTSPANLGSPRLSRPRPVPTRRRQARAARCMMTRRTVTSGGRVLP